MRYVTSRYVALRRVWQYARCSARTPSAPERYLGRKLRAPTWQFYGAMRCEIGIPDGCFVHRNEVRVGGRMNEYAGRSVSSDLHGGTFGATVPHACVANTSVRGRVRAHHLRLMACVAPRGAMIRLLSLSPLLLHSTPDPEGFCGVTGITFGDYLINPVHCRRFERLIASSANERERASSCACHL